MKKRIVSIIGLIFGVFTLSNIIPAEVPENALDYLMPAIRLYCYSVDISEKTSNEISTKYTDAENFWQKLHSFAIFNYEKHEAEGFNGADKYTEQQIIDIGYMLFQNFDGNIPNKTFQPEYGITYENGYYSFMLANPEISDFYLSDYQENSDGSIDATYIVEYQDYYNPEVMEPYASCDIHYELNPYVNTASATPYYYRVQKVTGKRIEQTVSQSDEQYIYPKAVRVIIPEVNWKDYLLSCYHMQETRFLLVMEEDLKMALSRVILTVSLGIMGQ